MSTTTLYTEAGVPVPATILSSGGSGGAPPPPSPTFAANVAAHQRQQQQLPRPGSFSQGQPGGFPSGQAPVRQSGLGGASLTYASSPTLAPKASFSLFKKTKTVNIHGPQDPAATQAALAAAEGGSKKKKGFFGLGKSKKSGSSSGSSSDSSSSSSSGKKRRTRRRRRKSGSSSSSSGSSSSGQKRRTRRRRRKSGSSSSSSGSSSSGSSSPEAQARRAARRAARAERSAARRAARAAKKAAATPPSGLGDEIGSLYDGQDEIGSIYSDVRERYRRRKMRRAARRAMRRERRRRERSVSAPFVASLLGTQSKPSGHSKRIFSSIGKRYGKLRRTENPPRAFLGALISAEAKYGSIETPIESFKLHKLLLEAYQSGEAITDAWIAQESETPVKLSGFVSPPISDTQIQATLVPKVKSPAMLQSRNQITLKLGSFQHRGVFVNTNTAVGTYHVPVDLYDTTHHDLYYGERIPTAHAVITVSLNKPGGVDFALESVTVLIDLKPSRTPKYIGYPRIEQQLDYVSPNAIGVFRHESGAHFRALHEAIAARLGASALLVSKHDQTLADPDASVIWGKMTGTAVSYAVIKLLGPQRADALDDPEFLKGVLAADATGKAVADKVAALMETMVRADTGKARQSFPTLRQLLCHTSGLPFARHISCEDALKMYDTASAYLNPDFGGDFGNAGTSEGDFSLTSSTSPYDEVESEFVKSLDMLPTMDSPPNAKIGAWNNSTEVMLVAMFLRRFVKPVQFPNQVVSNTLAELNSSIDLGWFGEGSGTDEWGLDVAQNYSPYLLGECARSKRSSFVAYIKQLAEELNTPNLNMSPFAYALSAQISVSEIGSTGFGWGTSTDNSASPIVFTANVVADVQTVVGFFLPALDFWGVVISDALVTSGINTSASDIVVAIANASKEITAPALPAGAPKQRSYQLENATYVRDVTDLPSVPGNFPFGVEFTSPFVDITFTYLPKLTLTPVADTPHVASATVTGPNNKVTAEFDIVYDAESGKYAVVQEDMTIGDEVLIGPDYVSVTNVGLFITAAKLMPVLKKYLDSVAALIKKADEDVFSGGKSEAILSKISKPSQASVMLRAHSGRIVASAPPSAIGHGLATGLVLGGLGGLALAGATRNYWGPPGYYYGYRPIYDRWGRRIGDPISSASTSSASPIGLQVVLGGGVPGPYPCGPFDPYCVNGYYPVGYVPPLYYPYGRGYGRYYGRPRGYRWGAGWGRGGGHRHGGGRRGGGGRRR